MRVVSEREDVSAYDSDRSLWRGYMQDTIIYMVDCDVMMLLESVIFMTIQDGSDFSCAGR